MNQVFEQFGLLPDLPPDLFDKIIKRIQKEKGALIIKRRIRIAFFFVCLLSSIVAIIPAFKSLWSGLYDSGFIQYFKLLFLDSGVILTYWQNFVLVLLETLPITSLIFCLLALLAFFESLNLFAKGIKSELSGFNFKIAK